MAAKYAMGKTGGASQKGKRFLAERRRLETLLESVPWGIVLVNEDGTFKYINHEFTELLGYNLNDLPNGKTWFRKAFPDPLYRRNAISTWVNDLNSSKPGERKPREFSVACKDGTVRFIRFITAFLETGENLMTCVDITDRHRAEEALRESEEKYSAVAKQAKDGVVILQDSTLQFVNKALADMLGYTVAEVENTPYINYVAPESRDLVGARGKARLSGQEVPQVYEAKLLRKDGTLIDVEMSASVIRYAGRPTDVGIIRDITDRKRADRLMRTQHDLVLALSAAPGLDEGLRLCLDAALSIPELDCGGVYLVDETTGALDLVFSEGLSQDFVKSISHYDADSPNTRLVMTATPIYARPTRLDVPWDEIQGQEGLQAIAILPLRHKDRVIGCLNIASHTLREIPLFSRIALESIAAQIGNSIARLRMEDALRDSEERFRLAMEATSDGLWDWDIRTDQGYFSPGYYRMLGYEPNEFPMTGRDWRNRIHPEDCGHTLGVNHDCIENRRESFEVEFRMKTKGGDWKWILGRGKAVNRDANGKALRMVGTHVDITERKLAADRLRDSRERLQALSARLQNIREEERTLIAREVHDELGQSLTALKMDLAWLSKRFPKGEETWLKKTKTMSTLIDSIIQSVRRISTQLRPGVLDDLGLAAAIEWQAQDFQERTGIKCRFSPSQEDFNLDRNCSTGLFRIFQETLTNVARHSRATRVTVSLNKKNGQLKLIVRDNGKGITENKISSLKSLGLIGMRERAHLLEGELEIKGIRGRGTTVTVRVPIKKKHSVREP